MCCCYKQRKRKAREKWGKKRNVVSVFSSSLGWKLRKREKEHAHTNIRITPDLARRRTPFVDVYTKSGEMSSRIVSVKRERKKFFFLLPLLRQLLRIVSLIHIEYNPEIINKQRTIKSIEMNALLRTRQLSLFVVSSSSSSFIL